MLSEAFPKGVELTINSYLRPGVSESPRMNEAVAGYWGKVGVKTKLVPMEYGTHRTKQARGEIPNIAAGMPIPNRPFWHGAWRVVKHSKGTLTMTKIPELDAMIEGLEGEVDLSRAVQRQSETARYIRENHLVVSLLETGGLYAGNPKKVTKWNLGKLFLDINLYDLFR